MCSNLTRLLVLVFLSGFSVCSLAQTITTVESRCVNTGEVIFSGTVGSGGPYQLSVTSYPSAYTPTGTHVVASLPDTFAALFPGTYSFKIIDQLGAVFNYPDVVVAGNYVLPGNNDYVPVSTGVTNCATFNGSISGTMTNGRPPFTYTIMSGPAQAGITNTTGTFIGLPPGEYNVQAADSCQNIQTRSVTIVNNSTGSLSVSNAYIHRNSCTTFSLDSIKVLPSFPSPGRYEIINDDGNGNSVTRASGRNFPVTFTVFTSRDIPKGRIKINVYDSCGNVATYTPFRYSGYVADSILAGVINRIGCDRYSLDALTVSPQLPAGATVQVKNTATGNIFSSQLPVQFNASAIEIATGNILIKVTDSCGGVDSTNLVRIISNYWNFTPNLKIYCNAVVIDSINFSGFVALPISVKVKALFRTPSGVSDSTITQTVSSFPYTITGIADNANPLTIKIEVTDSCGEIRRTTLTQSFALSAGSLQSNNCNLTSIILSPGGKFVLPVTYSVSPDAGISSNITGSFNLPPGSYTFTATDSCGKQSTYGPLIIDKRWKLQEVKQKKNCSSQYISNIINVPAKPAGKLTIHQYQGGMPVTNASTLLSTKFFTSAYNGCAGCGTSNITDEVILFDTTLPGHTYTYIVTDTCGRSDTVSIINDSVQPFYHTAFSKTKCVRGSDVYANWRSDGDPANSVGILVYDENGRILLGFNSQSLTNVDDFPDGQILLYDAAPGRYIISYTFLNCPQVFYDTVITKDYVQPTVSAVQSFAPCSGGSPVVITGADGIGPYQYQIINSYPGHLTLPPQTNPVFTLPVSQSTVTVRVIDVCLNSSTRTVAVTRAITPIIRSSPALLSTCTLPFNFRLFVDSVFDGSVFKWTKITGTGAGTTVISSRPFINITYNSIADTGTYKVKITIPGTCFEEDVTFDVNNVTITCLPGITGNVFDDANGLRDGIVNGYGTNAGGLSAALINALNTVVAVSPVSSSGVYNFPGIAGGTYSVIITTSAAVINAPAPVATLPIGWVNTGEHTGVSAGNDGLANGKLANILIDTVTASELNFGIDHIPVTNDTVEYRTNPGGTIQVQVPVLTGSDLEDGIYDGASGINTIIIQSLPANAILYYNGSPVTIAQVINNYNPSLLTIDPLDNIAAAQFTFSEVDAALLPSLPDTAIIFFYGLPVRILDFTATPVQEKVRLNWSVAEQINILHYTVEHSTDGNHFKEIVTTTAENVTSYNMLHTSPVNGINYYRLKITETNGKISYSKIATTQFNLSSAITIKPNPFKSSIDVAMELKKASPVTITLYDAEGRIVQQNAFNGVVGNNIFTITKLDKLSRGIYVVSVAGNEFAVKSKIFKD
jgi:hypothetical protein